MAVGQGDELSLFPNGNIPIGCFIKLDTTTEGYCLVADSGSRAIGVAGLEPHTMQITIQGVSLADGFAGIAGGPAIKAYPIGATKVPLCVLTASGNPGDLLKPDTGGTGKGVVTTNTSEKIAAISRQAWSAANTIIEVDLVRMGLT